MRRLALILAIVSTALLSGCGYTFTGMNSPGGEDAASRLAPELRQMALIRVDTPTTETWIEPRLRSLIRDEFNRRRLVTWTERAQATSLLTVIVKKFSRSTYVAGEQNQSVKLNTNLVLIFKVTRASDGAVLWDSGQQTQRESFYPGDAEGADMRITDMAVRRMADLLTQHY
jgi:outer membrane lipopolysaccharide assembly protein LptE/RlpB